MPSRPESLVPPLVATVVAAALVLRRYVTVLLFELGVDVSASNVTQLTLGARFAVFVLVYALLLGAAYWVGASAGDDVDDTLVVGATFALATLAALVTTAAMLAVLGTGTAGLALTVVATGATSVATGVKLAVVAFAGLVVGRR